jgi:hypothetical protein
MLNTDREGKYAQRGKATIDALLDVANALDSVADGRSKTRAALLSSIKKLESLSSGDGVDRELLEGLRILGSGSPIMPDDDDAVRERAGLFASYLRKFVGNAGSLMHRRGGMVSGSKARA